MKTSLFKSLYFQVLTAIAIGILLGHYYPELGAQMKPLGDAFVKLIKMIIAPVIFCTVVTGIAGMESMKAVGRTGAVALLYFEIVSTIALIIGLIIVNVVQPGAGMNVDPATLDAQAVAVYAAQAKEQGIIAFLMDVIPGSVIGAFASGNILQVLLFAVLFGFALHRLGSKGQLIFNVIESFSQVIFGIINMIMRLAPIGAFGAMAFTIGKYGVGSLVQLGQLIICFYITCILFVVVVLGTIARVTGFSIFKFIRYIREELLIVLGTSSSESALPRMLDKMEKLGCRKSVVGLVIPTGYSFNLDGTSILPDDGGGVYRPGDQQPYGYLPPDNAAGRAAALVKRRRGRDRKRLYCAGGHYLRRGPFTGCGTGVNPWYRPLYVRSARAD